MSDDVRPCKDCGRDHSYRVLLEHQRCVKCDQAHDVQLLSKSMRRLVALIHDWELHKRDGRALRESQTRRDISVCAQSVIVGAAVWL